MFKVKILLKDVFQYDIQPYIGCAYFADEDASMRNYGFVIGLFAFNIEFMIGSFIFP